MNTDRRSSVGRLEGRLKKKKKKERERKHLEVLWMCLIEGGRLIDSEMADTAASLRWDNLSGWLRGEIYHCYAGNRDYIQQRWTGGQW